MRFLRQTIWWGLMLALPFAVVCIAMSWWRSFRDDDRINFSFRGHALTLRSSAGTVRIDNLREQNYSNDRLLGLMKKYLALFKEEREGQRADDFFGQGAIEFQERYGK